jgi:molecular chaperone DnaK
MNNILGIDLGTTNSCMAFIEFGEAEVIENAENERTTPSVVYFKKDGEVVVGRTAKQNIVANAARTVRSIKRHMGTDYEVEIDKEKYPPEYVSAHVLKKLADDAGKFTGRKFTDAVISVPAYFTDAQRQATKDAGEIAGFNVRRVINEPTAAAIAYGFKEDDEKTILVYDFGGGTFDVSILTIGGGFFDVDATSGDNHLGGDDMDELIEDYLIEDIKKKHGINIKKDLTLYQALKEKSENAKIELSDKEKVTINIPNIGKSGGVPVSYSTELTRKKFNEMIMPLVERTKKPMKDALEDASLETGDIDDVILVGGPTRIPLIRKFVRDFFQKEPNTEVNPDEAVAVGAALSIMSGREAREKKESERIKRPVEISDVISRSLGTLTFDGYIVKMIEKNTKIPIKVTKEFTNPLPFMEEINVNAYQGESMFPDGDDADLLGEFSIDLEPKPMHENKIEATFEIGEDFGILHVTAKDIDSGNERTVKMIARGRLSTKEKDKWMERMSEFHNVEVNFGNPETKRELTLNLNPNSTIRDIKKKLMETDMMPSGACLFYNDEELDDDTTISNAKIGDGDTVEIKTKE